MRLATIQDLFINELKDLYSAEHQILKALPKMAKAAATPELQAAFTEHHQQTQTHVERLQQILDRLDMPTPRKKCKAMEGIIEEGKEIISEDAEDVVRDAALIGAAQRVEHYEIASYGCARTYAQLMGDQVAAKLLQETLDEEGETDKKLTQLAENLVNVQAAAV